MIEIKFSYMWSNGKRWIDKRYTLDQIEQGYPFDDFSNEPLLRSFKLKDSHREHSDPDMCDLMDDLWMARKKLEERHTK